MIETPKVSDQSLIYMYGISDFWSDIFGDKDLVEAILASTTITLAEVYSYFLQRSAGISLMDISERYETRIKLIRIDSSKALDDEGTTFPIDSEYTDIPKISNRPILPTQTLSNNVHYEIIDGTIRFHRPLSELKFPVRYTATGTQEYALWGVDVEINEKWIDNSFGRLVGFTEEDAIFNYKSFLEGVYYLYSNGPNISYIERGVNLAMGMPYARDTEQVLDIRQDAYTGNWIVFTETNAYELPFGYRPEMSVGDTLVENQVLTTWVEIRDYVRNGAWWYDVYLPREVLGNGQEPSEVGKCVEGSTGDAMMQNFLKHHMFEVSITQPNGDERSFDTARNLVLYSKPEYTFPIFVWRVPLTDENIIIEDDITMQLRLDLEDTMISPPSIRHMDRGDDSNPFIRGRHWYNRFQSSMYTATLLGFGDWMGNAGWAPEFESVSDRYLSILDTTMRTRGDTVCPRDRDTVTRGWRGHVDNTDEFGNPLDDDPNGYIWNIPGSKVIPQQTEDLTFNDRLTTPLYMMSETEMVQKMRTLKPNFTLSSGDFRFVLTGLNLPQVYSTLMVRNQEVLDEAEGSEFEFIYSNGGLDDKLSLFSKQCYVPRMIDLYDDGQPITDGRLFITKNTRTTWSVIWIRDRIRKAPTIFPVEDQDYLRAIEVYDQDDVGTTFPHRDKLIAAGQFEVSSPVLIGSEGFPLITIGDSYLPAYAYEVASDDVTITLDSIPTEEGNASWVPYLYDEIILPADGDTYVIPVEITELEEVFISYSPVSTGYSFITGYSITPGVGETTIILDTSLPAGGDVIFTFADKGSAPDQESFSPNGTTYTIQAGYTVKILTDGKLVNDRSYLISGTSLIFSEAPTSDFVVRYYPTLEYELLSSFNRGTVAKNRARFLMDRDRVNGEYDDNWEGLDGQGTPIVYINRGGKAWAEVPELGETPVYADSVNVIRRLL